MNEMREHYKLGRGSKVISMVVSVLCILAILNESKSAQDSVFHDGYYAQQKIKMQINGITYINLIDNKCNTICDVHGMSKISKYR